MSNSNKNSILGWIVCYAALILIPCFVVSGFWTFLLGMVLSFCAFGYIANYFNLDVENSLKKLIPAFVLCVLCGINGCSNGGGSGTFINGSGTYVSKIYDNGRDVDVTYTFKFYNDGSVVHTEAATGQYNYTNEYRGEWENKRISYHDVDYVYTQIKSNGNNSHEYYIIDADGRLYSFATSDGLYNYDRVGSALEDGRNSYQYRYTLKKK